jgi:hypothetical protein
MITASEKMVLYHASYQVIDKIDLYKCAKKNDFGQGFYVTTDKEQAEKFVKTSIKKSGRNLAGGFVNEYSLDTVSGLSIYIFSKINKEWLHCVCGHRRFDLFEPENEKWQQYDIIAGKIANDDTMTVINIYIANGYGDYGSQAAIDTAIALLKPERLKNQLCIKTQAAVNRLQFTGFFEVPVK